MMHVSRSIHIPYGVKALGAALLIGYLGYRVVRWLLQCPQANRINAVIKKAFELITNTKTGSSTKSKENKTPSSTPQDLQALQDQQLHLSARRIGKTEWAYNKVFSAPVPTPQSSPATSLPSESASESSESEAFAPFELEIIVPRKHGQETTYISSVKEMRRIAQEIVTFVEREHVAIEIDSRLVPPIFLNHLRSLVELENDNVVLPKILLNTTTDVDTTTGKTRLIRAYVNGMIEEEDRQDTEQPNNLLHWTGLRKYPDGTVQKGLFNFFCMTSGTTTSPDNTLTLYRRPQDILCETHNRALLSNEVHGQKQLIVALKPSPSIQNLDFIPNEESPYSLMTQQLKDDLEKDWAHDRLEVILSDQTSGYVHAFIEYLFSTKQILEIKNNHVFDFLLSYIRKYDRELDRLYQTYPDPALRRVLLIWRAKDKGSLEDVFRLDPTLFSSQERQKERAEWIRALLLLPLGAEFPFFDELKGRGISLLPEEALFEKVAAQNLQRALNPTADLTSDVTQDKLRVLSPDAQATVYQFANMYHNFPLLRTMRGLGFGGKETLPKRAGSLFGCDMDALSIHDGMRKFLTDLRSQNTLLTQAEYDQLPTAKDYTVIRDVFIDCDEREPEPMGSFVTHMYIEATAHNLDLKHIQCAKKILVLKEDDFSKILQRDYSNTHFSFYVSNQLKIDSNSPISVFTNTGHSHKSDVNKMTVTQAADLLTLCEATQLQPHQFKFFISNDVMYITHVIATPHDYYTRSGDHYERMKMFVQQNLDHLQEAERESLCQELSDKCTLYQEQEEQLDHARQKRMKIEETALKKQFPSEYGMQVFFPIQDIIPKKSESKKDS